MNIKATMIALSLLGFISVAIAENNNQEIILNNHNTKFFNHAAVSIIKTGKNQEDARYEVLISQAVTKPNPHTTFPEPIQPTIQVIDKPIWIITSDQLPITEDDCDKANIDTCDKDQPYCYRYCLAYDPEILAFDEKANKLYFMYGTIEIGTGGGAAFLFEGDVNKKEVKLLNMESYGEDGTLSPSGRYLVLHGYSIITVYDTQTNMHFDINKSGNIYSDKQIRHSLRVKRWLSDTQFSYIDIARYFTHKTEDQPFINAKEVIYDIATRKVLHERRMTEDEYKSS